MITICKNCTVSLPYGVNDMKGLAINHHDFLFLDCSGCKIIKWTKCSHTMETIMLTRKYLCFCFDDRENCYWAVPESEPNRIYRLDLCFNELDSIAVSGTFQQRATGLSCDDEGKGIWISYTCQLAFLDICSGKVTWCKNKDNQRINLGIAVTCGCRIVHYYENNRQIIEALFPCVKDCIELCVPKKYHLVAMAPYPCERGCSCCRFCMIALKACSHELVLKEYCIDFTEKPQEHYCNCPCQPDLCPQPCPSKSCPPYPIPLCGGNHKIMHSTALEETEISHILNFTEKPQEHCCDCPCPPHPCPQPCPPKPCPPYPMPPCGGSYEIMHSIALEEAGISHILNAEGEKIQKAVAVSSNIEELICLNESVKHTLTQVTILEGMLYSKLEALINCNDFCHEKPLCQLPCNFDNCEMDVWQ